MRFKSIASAAALAAAMLLSGSAFAQTLIGGVEVSAEDLAAVTTRCEELVLADTTTPIAGESEKEDAVEMPNDGTTPADPLADATSKIDLESITLAQCQEAGLGGAM